MKLIQHLVRACLCLLLFSTFSTQSQAQVANVNYPCGFNLVGSPHLYIQDVVINGSSTLGLLSYYAPAGTPITVDVYFDAPGYPASTIIYGGFQIDHNLNGGFDGGSETISSGFTTAGSGVITFTFIAPPMGQNYPVQVSLDPNQTFAHNLAPNSACQSEAQAPFVFVPDPVMVVTVASDPDPYVEPDFGFYEGAWCIEMLEGNCFGEVLEQEIDMDDPELTGNFILRIKMKERRLSPNSFEYTIAPLNREPGCPKSNSTSNPLSAGVDSDPIQCPNGSANFDLEVRFTGDDLPSYKMGWSNIEIPDYYRGYVQVLQVIPTGGYTPVMVQGSNGTLTSNFVKNVYQCPAIRPGRTASPDFDASDASSELRVIPNPTLQASTVHFGIPQKGAVQLKLMDLQGRTIQLLENGLQTEGQYEYPLDLQGLPQGIYLLQLNTEAGTQVERVLKL